MSVNVNGVLYTAQAAGRQMTRFETPGSIILIASMSGSITNQVNVLFNEPSKLLTADTGTIMGCIQHEQVSGQTDSSKYGM